MKAVSRFVLTELLSDPLLAEKNPQIVEFYLAFEFERGNEFLRNCYFAGIASASWRHDYAGMLHFLKEMWDNPEYDVKLY